MGFSGIKAASCLIIYYMPIGEENLVLEWSDCSAVIEDIAGRLRKMAPGERIRVVFANQDFAIDISAWCHETGNRLIELGAQDDKYYAVIEKA